MLKQAMLKQAMLKQAMLKKAHKLMIRFKWYKNTVNKNTNINTDRQSDGIMGLFLTDDCP